LFDNRTVFETPGKKFFRQAWRYLIVAGLILLAIQSIRIIDQERTSEVVEKSTISAIYHGSKAEVEANKAKAFQKLEIAGAGDDTRQTKERR
jgi:hypothetical protein